MDVVMIIVSVIVMLTAFVCTLIHVGRFLCSIGDIFGFGGETKCTEAILTGYRGMGLGTVDSPRRATPIVKYYNEFIGEYVSESVSHTNMVSPDDLAKWYRKKLERKGIIVAKGEKVQVEYTAKRVRVIDPRFVNLDCYKIATYVKPVILSAIAGFVGFVILVVTVV